MLDELGHPRLGLPAQHRLGLGGISAKHVNFSGTEKRGVDDYEFLVVEPDVFEGDLAHVAHGCRHTRCNHVVVRLVLLEHEPHRFDVVACESPVALCIDVAETKLRLLAKLDSGYRVGYLACHEFYSSQR